MPAHCARPIVLLCDVMVVHSKKLSDEELVKLLKDRASLVPVKSGPALSSRVISGRLLLHRMDSLFRTDSEILQYEFGSDSRLVAVRKMCIGDFARLAELKMRLEATP